MASSRALTVVLLAVQLAATACAQPLPKDADVHAVNRRLGRGINLGNALEAPKEGDWGVTLEADYFRLIAEAGFDSVRIPARWDVRTQAQPPYTIDPAFLGRVQWAVDEALASGLAVVLDSHHYAGANKDAAAELPRYRAIWRQISLRFRDYPNLLVFELHNEPHDDLDAATWNAYFPKLLAEVRRTNPTRAVIVGPTRWNNLPMLPTLELPDDDHLIVTVHDYEPFQFTHQGATWIGPETKDWLGTTWTGTDEQKRAMNESLDIVAKYAREHDVPVYVGEFGAYREADIDSRALWTRSLVEAMEARGFSWAYWEFCSGFGVYDPQSRQWRRSLLHTLLPEAVP